MSNKEVTEFELVAAAHTKGAERVNDKQVEEFIKAEHYFTAAEGVYGNPEVGEEPDPLDLLTFCVLVLQNGFTVYGVSACADPKNFDKVVGQRLARSMAKNKIWELLGFELKSKMCLADKLPV